MKRKVIVVGIALLCVMLIGGTALAAVSYNFTFTDILTTLSTTTGAKDDSNSRSYKLYISGSSTLSGVNVLGARPRDAGTNDYAGSYYTYTSSGNYTKSYYSSAMPLRKVYFRMKKDDSSSAGWPLNVDGNFTP